jgi:hypothetical protein
MPRRSSADLSIPDALRGAPSTLQPPPNLAGRERELFVEFVKSLPPKHLAQEDVQLVVAYVRCLVQDEIAAAQINNGSRDPYFVTLASAARRGIKDLSTRLRIGPRSRQPNNTRQPASALPPSQHAMPWEGNRILSAVPRDDGDGTGERSFARLRERAFGAESAPPADQVANQGAIGTLKANKPLAGDNNDAQKAEGRTSTD